MSEFRRIEKYIVINKNDVMDYLNEREFAGLELALSAIRHGRREEGKEKKNYVCVSDKDAEQFEAAWSIIDGTHANLAEENQRLTAIATKHSTVNDERYELLEKQKSDIEKMLDQLFKHEKVDGWLACKMNDMLDDVNHQLEKSRIEAEKGDGIYN